MTATVTEELDHGGRIVEFSYDGIFLEVLESLGEMPLPPYIHEKLEDRDRYQTVYAKENGSAAAPTAGLHFTPELLQKIEAKGVKLVYLTLHVGLGTFRPVSVENVDEHEMHSEFYTLSQEAADTLNSVKAAGVVDAFSTNFHLPKSTLVMLVSAFADREFVLDAYKHAVQERYRFFSFGDAMFVTRRAEK